MDDMPGTREMQAEPLKSSQATVIFVIAVIALGVVATICAAGSVFLAYNDKQVPDALLQTCGTALTLLGALFVARAAGAGK